MREPIQSVSEVDLHAYVDGQLDPQRKDEIEAFLEVDPEIAVKVTDCLQINQGLHDLFDDTLKEPLPERFKNTGKPIRNRWVVMQAAAILGAITIGTTTGWIARGELEPTPGFTQVLVDNAFTAHAVYTPEVRHPVEVDAEQEKHLTTWLSKRLKTPIRAPKLSSMGYELLGGRLLAVSRGPAAQFMYQDNKGNRLTLFVTRKEESTNNTAFRVARQEGGEGFYWIDGKLGYVLLGDVEKPIISQAAHLVYEELNK